MSLSSEEINNRIVDGELTLWPLQLLYLGVAIAFLLVAAFFYFSKNLPDAKNDEPFEPANKSKNVLISLTIVITICFGWIFYSYGEGFAKDNFQNEIEKIVSENGYNIDNGEIELIDKTFNLEDNEINDITSVLSSVDQISLERRTKVAKSESLTPVGFNKQQNPLFKLTDQEALKKATPEWVELYRLYALLFALIFTFGIIFYSQTNLQYFDFGLENMNRILIVVTFF